MNVTERNVVRLAAVQHLRTTYGIKTKIWSRSKGRRSSCKLTASQSVSLSSKLPYRPVKLIPLLEYIYSVALDM